MICLVTALVIIGTGQTHVGALCGWITYMIYGTGYNDLIGGGGGGGVTFHDGDSIAGGGGGDYTPINVQPQDLDIIDDN